MKIKGEDVESYESIKTEDVESCERRQRMLSSVKLKTKDVESYETCQ